MPATIAIVGNPNVGKTEVFNALTGLMQTTGNYPGVTVSRKAGTLALNGSTASVIDLPGTYSLAARAPDEQIVADVLLDRQTGESPIDAILVVADATNLERNFYLLSQVQEFDKPIVLALNMMDLADKQGFSIDHEKLSELLGIPVVPICARQRKGTDQLKAAIRSVVGGENVQTHDCPQFSDTLHEEVAALSEELKQYESKLSRDLHPIEVFRLLVDTGGYAEQRLVQQVGKDCLELLELHRGRASSNGSLSAEEARCRYAWAHGLLETTVVKPEFRVPSASDRIDYILTHKVYGSVFFAAVMLVVFQSIYSWSAPLMDLIDTAFAAIGGAVAGVIPEGVLQSLIVDGMIAGIGSVFIFIPQILVLTLFIALLHDCGYMARAAFLMDRLFNACGLSGQSFIPMLSSFACAIPGVMATRTIENRRDRIATMLVAPLMSCSARLPVYVLMIAAFVPDRPLFGGIIRLQAGTLFAMYLIGIVVAIPVAWILKRTLLRGETPPFVLELPSYKAPRLQTVLHKVYLQGKEFMRRAGTIIFAVTIIVWALAYFPHAQQITDTYQTQRVEATAALGQGPNLDEALLDLGRFERGEHLENSYLGTMGHAIEPLVRPLGWDWRIGTAVVASFPAREIIVATLGTIFNLGEGADEASEGLRGALQAATLPTGQPLFNLPVALSVMVFFALCCQCAATLVMIRRESGSWKWPAITFTYMTVLAYVAAFLTYHGATLIGLGGTA